MEKVKNVLATIIAWVKSHVKLVAIIAAVIIVAIIVISFILGGDKRLIKSYVSAINKADAEKALKCMDMKGVLAAASAFGDEDEFVDKYEEIEDEDEDDLEDAIKEMEKSFEDSIEDREDNYKKYKVKFKKIKDKEKIDDDFYIVKAVVKLDTENEDGDKTDSEKTLDFWIYKGKIVYAEL